MVYDGLWDISIYVGHVLSGGDGFGSTRRTAASSDASFDLGKENFQRDDYVFNTIHTGILLV